ncbi:Hypothetical predicted protein [Octopus vulgaris]|uniref:Uncharacterized protein n=1 Tax=Octopus vulgaris TaxID=6645 RepID=A0AA36BY66_OCTVU|nr:Hypothetical predicted protein [Octopus vulgaris]
MQPHIANTKVTTVQAHEEREKVLNAHMMMWTIVLGPQKRTAKNFQAWNNDIPALYGLRKDHKGFTDPIAGPPTRPVCGANIASNYRISYFLSMIIRPIIRMSPDVCDSTEDLLSRISDCNKTCDLTGCIEKNLPYRSEMCKAKEKEFWPKQKIPSCEGQLFKPQLKVNKVEFYQA